MKPALPRKPSIENVEDDVEKNRPTFLKSARESKPKVPPSELEFKNKPTSLDVDTESVTDTPSSPLPSSADTGNKEYEEDAFASGIVLTTTPPTPTPPVTPGPTSPTSFSPKPFKSFPAGAQYRHVPFYFPEPKVANSPEMKAARPFAFPGGADELSNASDRK